MPNLPSKNLGLHHAALRVPNMRAAVEFYALVLGFQVERIDPDQTTFLTTGTDSLTLALQQDNAPRQIDHVGFVVPTLQDVHRWEAYLREKGVTIKRTTQVFRDGSSGCSVLDPGDNEVQVLYHPTVVDGLTRSLPHSATTPRGCSGAGLKSIM